MELASRAGDLLLEMRKGLGERGAESAREATELRDAGDRRSDDLILAALAVEAPGDGVLSEETADTAARLGASRVWIVDPLDGTREYGEAGRSDWAVHVALAIEGEPAVGAVALPALGTVLSTQSPPSLPPARGDGLRMAVSRTRPPAQATHTAQALGAELVPMGSAGAKAMAVVRGEVDLYLHAGGQYEWDSCAPVAVALAAGCHCSRLDGSPLLYNNADPYLPDLFICRPELAVATLEALSQLP